MKSQEGDLWPSCSRYKSHDTGSSRAGTGSIGTPSPLHPLAPEDFIFFFYDVSCSFKAAAAPLGPDCSGRKQVLVPSGKVNQRFGYFSFFKKDRYSEERKNTFLRECLNCQRITQWDYWERDIYSWRWAELLHLSGLTLKPWERQKFLLIGQKPDVCKLTVESLVKVCCAKFGLIFNFLLVKLNVLTIKTLIKVHNLDEFYSL